MRRISAVITRCLSLSFAVIGLTWMVATARGQEGQANQDLAKDVSELKQVSKDGFDKIVQAIEGLKQAPKKEPNNNESTTNQALLELISKHNTRLDEQNAELRALIRKQEADLRELTGQVLIAGEDFRKAVVKLEADIKRFNPPPQPAGELTGALDVKNETLSDQVLFVRSEHWRDEVPFHAAAARTTTIPLPVGKFSFRLAHESPRHRSIAAPGSRVEVPIMNQAGGPWHWDPVLRGWVREIR
jgi:hypothetical protein